MTMSSPVAVIHGYYRYTDIMFEWHQLIPDPAEVSALKAFLNSASLVDPANPLRKPGAKGIGLYLGTMPSGQARLLFSSAQIEYIRYYLHAVGLTKNKLPLPSSESLLTESILRNCSPVIYKSTEELKRALRVIDKNNKRLKGTDTALMSIRQAFERIRTFWAEKKGTWLAIDLEAWEMEHTVLTEFGWSSITWHNGEEATTDGHLIVSENWQYRNGKYVPDYKDPQYYQFGTSEMVSKAAFRSRINQMITEFSSGGPLFLVFHDSSQDVKYLRSKSVDAPLESLTYLLPDAPPDEGIFVVDTSDMFAALEGMAGDRTAFKRMCNLLKIETQFLHNAGNDAHYTLVAMMVMASGNQLDVQREERWPNHTDTGVPKENPLKVDFEAWEEDDDYSDTEGMMAPLRRPIAEDDQPSGARLIAIDDFSIKDEPMSLS